jgi:hypothetical protein
MSAPYRTFALRRELGLRVETSGIKFAICADQRQLAEVLAELKMGKNP